MGRNLAIISALLCLQLATTVFGGVPVLLWESSDISDKNYAIPALNQLDGDEFATHLIKKVHSRKPLVVLFVEETLSVEDFSWKDEKRHGAFPKLENITAMAAKMEFIPSVFDPVGALKDLVHSQGYTYQKFDRSNLRVKPGTVLEVSLSDPLFNEDRPRLLRRHDEDVTRTYSELLAAAPRIIALFTGRQNSWVEADANRVRREANNNSAISWQKGSMKLAARSAKLTVSNKTYELGNPDTLTPDDRTGFSRIIYTYIVDDDKTKITLRLKFKSEAGSWSIVDCEVMVNNQNYGLLTPKTKISAPVGQSFNADEIVLDNANGNASLVFTAFQAEKFSRANQKAFSASASSNTVFFTGPIWMGLLVSWTLLFILAIGITMLMDIKTMDRFDDPKGKSITVSATD
ncbi:vacuolar ATP synthase subunit S1 [Nesidiocoris tenuis]|uniref:Vacuolar ATP synthase subunit S1 n=1 Tax=Nesidiocoris tenuis TaxID=355587 RepID=A0ABN7AVK2_9HEMI|nr:vacuolar ATP synthase subunit S1 [Nesidiocoris tenuis]